MKSWPLFFLPFALFATVNEPLRWELSSGYRNDRIHWHLQNSGDDAAQTYSELSRDVQFWENALTLKVIHRDLSFFMRGAYGAFGQGNVFQKFSDLPFTTDQPQFEYNSQGWSADAAGYFGYAVNLTADRIYKVILTPLMGLSGHFERLERKGVRPDPYAADGFTMAASLHPLHMTWWGFFLGGGFTIEPGNCLILNAGYTYHWLRMRLNTKWDTLVDPGVPSETTMRATEGGNLGHTGWAQIDGMLGRYWRLGLGGLIHYFSSKVTPAEVSTSIEGAPPVSTPQKIKLRWATVSGWAQISREF